MFINRRDALTGAGIGALVATGAGVMTWRQSTGSLQDYAAYAGQLRHPPIAPAELADLVRYGTLAANSHNTQGWRFRIVGNEIELRPDAARRTPVVDPDDHHLFVTLGCAAENIAIAASKLGWTCDVQPSSDGAIRFILGKGDTVPDPLFNVIAQRQSTRTVYEGRPASPDMLAALAGAGARDGVSLTLFTDKPRMERLRDLAVAGNDAQLGDPAFVAELKHWLRFNPRTAMAKGDGLFSASAGNQVMPDWLGAYAFDLFFTAKSESDRLARQIMSSSGAAIFTGDRPDRLHWIAVGRACQRFALKLTQLGLKCAFINQPVEVATLRPELASLIGMNGKRPDIVMRFGYGPAMPYAPRRPLASVIA